MDYYGSLWIVIDHYGVLPYNQHQEHTPQEVNAEARWHSHTGRDIAAQSETVTEVLKPKYKTII